MWNTIFKFQTFYQLWHHKWQFDVSVMMRFPGRSEETSYTTRLVSYKPKPRLEEHRLASCLITGQDSGGRERHKQGIPSSAHSPCFTEGFPLSNKCPTLSTSSKKKKKRGGWSRLKLRAHLSPPAPTLKKKERNLFLKDSSSFLSSYQIF